MLRNVATEPRGTCYELKHRKTANSLNRPFSNLVVSCPTNKADDISKYFKERGWSSVEVVPEDKLFNTFSAKDDTETDKTKEIPDQVAGVSMFMPGAFAAQFKCACPKCGRD